VVETLRGASSPGARLTVVQLGGTDRGGLKVVSDKDPLLNVGDQEILFLRRDPASGKFFTVGGGQGRFQLASNGTVTAVDQSSVVGKRHHGQSQIGFSEEIRAR
jgi:hypothetical protein